MAGEGGADGSILGVCGGVLPVFKLLVLPVDGFLLGLLCKQREIKQLERRTKKKEKNWKTNNNVSGSS